MAIYNSKTRPKLGHRLSKAEFEALAEFRYQLRMFSRFSEDTARACGLTPLQYQLLLQIRGFPGHDSPSISDLAKRLQRVHHGVVALVTRCERDGLVQKVRSFADRRRVKIHLTAEGKRAVQCVAALHRKELRLLATALSIHQLGAFHQNQTKFAAS